MNINRDCLLNPPCIRFPEEQKQPVSVFWRDLSGFIDDIKSKLVTNMLGIVDNAKCASFLGPWDVLDIYV